MPLSVSGTKMASRSGLRCIMEDIATTPTGAFDEWINLSIGNPAAIPEVVSMWHGFMQEALAYSFEKASCQYGPSRGSATLLNALARYFNARYGWGITTENIVVGPGSQMLCFAAAALFTGWSTDGRRSLVLPGVPEYTGYQGLSLNAGDVVGIPPIVVHIPGDRTFHYALDTHALEEEPNIGMILLSSPCNPTGRSLGSNELSTIARVAEERNVPVLIDNAYGSPFPRISGTETAPIRHPNVINCFSISKAGLPGERIGFALGEKHYMDAITSFISNATLHAPQLSQIVLARALETGELDRVTTSVIKPYYERKRRFAETLLFDLWPETVEWRLHSGEGGMFCWLWIDHPWFDDEAFYQMLKRRKVFIVPGRHFFVDPLCVGDHGTRCFRISLTAEEATIAEGIMRVGDALQELSCALHC
jgi:valine--pyruvate aminotransferase